MARVAALADVHGNALALQAVLPEVEAAGVDLVVFCGDLTWGSLPRETLELVEPWRERARFVRGNADRATGVDLEGRGAWMAAQHDQAALEFLRSFEESIVIDVEGLGPTRFCHGSPRSDEECVTVATPEERMRELLEGVAERVLVTAHTHVQFDREVVGVRSVNPGSVGLPYEDRRGAYWALLGPDVELERTQYDVEAAAQRFRQTDDPAAERVVELLLTPPRPAEVIAHAESVVFSG